MISRIPCVICLRVRAMMPATTSTTAMIHKMKLMSYTPSERREESVSIDGTMTVGSVKVVVMSTGKALDGAWTVVLR